MSGLLDGDPAVGLWLVRGLAALASVLGVGVAFLLAHHGLSLRRERRLRRRVTMAAEFLAPFLAGSGDASAAVARARSRWGTAAVTTVLRRARRLLADPGEQLISRLLEELGQTGRLARTARRGSPLRRGRALRLLGECGGGAARRELLRATADRRPEIRRLAREGLVELREPFAVRAAVAAFVGEAELTTSWRRSFFLRLAVYAPGELRRLAASACLDLADQKLVLEALAETGDAAALPLALEGLRSPAAELRAAAVRLLGVVGDHRWAPLLASRLEDREWFVRAAAARALGGVRPSFAACRALGERLADTHWWVRANAAGSLARQGSHGVRWLSRAAHGGDGFARQAALPVLLRLEGEPAARPEVGDRLRPVKTAASDPPARVAAS